MPLWPSLPRDLDSLQNFFEITANIVVFIFAFEALAFRPFQIMINQTNMTDSLSINRTNIPYWGWQLIQKMEAYFWYIVAFLAALLIFWILASLWDTLMRRKAKVNFIVKGQVLSPAKTKAFDLLCQTFPGDYEILANMFLGELLEPGRSKIGQKWLGFSQDLLRRPVDFVVVRRSDFSPVMAVMVDIGSEAKENIRFLQNALAGAKFKFIVTNQDELNQPQNFQEKITKLFQK